MIVLFLNFFMKSYVVSTHYNLLIDKVLLIGRILPAISQDGPCLGWPGM